MYNVEKRTPHEEGRGRHALHTLACLTAGTASQQMRVLSHGVPLVAAGRGRHALHTLACMTAGPIVDPTYVLSLNTNLATWLMLS